MPGRGGRRREEACVMYGFCSEGLRDFVRVRPNVNVGDESPTSGECFWWLVRNNL